MWIDERYTTMNKKMKIIAVLLTVLILTASVFSGCTSPTPSGDANKNNSTYVSDAGDSDAADTDSDDSDASGNAKGTFTQIKAEEVFRIRETESDYIILDVRTQEEYDAGHIPDAICIPNEIIQAFKPDGGNTVIEGLPDKEQKILIYCRSGNRSKQAAQKLADLGYTQIYEFGGIRDWPGKIVTS